MFGDAVLPWSPEDDRYKDFSREDCNFTHFE